MRKAQFGFNPCIGRSAATVRQHDFGVHSSRLALRSRAEAATPEARQRVACLTRRLQGRPIRGDGDVGRERLIEAARQILRSAPPSGIMRKAVADIADVTPALFSYLCPRKQDLVSAAIRPILGSYLQQLNAIFDAPDAMPERLRHVVALFVELHRAESHLSITHSTCAGTTLRRRSRIAAPGHL